MSSVVSTTGTTFNLQYADQTGTLHNLNLPLVVTTPAVPPRTNALGRVLFIEDFRHPQLGMFSDGAGSAHRDNEIPFGGLPTARLDPQGTVLGATNPGTSGPSLSGVVFKRRVKDNYSGLFGMEFWLRLTSGNQLANANSIPSCSIYNRDGLNGHFARIWFDLSDAGGNISLRYLNSSGTYVLFDTWVQNTNYHAYQLDQGFTDVAGEWYYVKFIADMKNKNYVSFQFNDRVTTFAANTGMRIVADTSPADQHFSIEYAQNSSVRRFINIAQVIGTLEG